MPSAAKQGGPGRHQGLEKWNEVWGGAIVSSVTRRYISTCLDDVSRIRKVLGRSCRDAVLSPPQTLHSYDALNQIYGGPLTNNSAFLSVSSCCGKLMVVGLLLGNYCAVMPLGVSVISIIYLVACGLK